jgi:hypothetical protein
MFIIIIIIIIIIIVIINRGGSRCLARNISCHILQTSNFKTALWTNNIHVVEKHSGLELNFNVLLVSVLEGVS